MDNRKLRESARFLSKNWTKRQKNIYILLLHVVEIYKGIRSVVKMLKLIFLTPYAARIPNPKRRLKTRPLLFALLFATHFGLIILFIPRSLLQRPPVDWLKLRWQSCGFVPLGTLARLAAFLTVGAVLRARDRFRITLPYTGSTDQFCIHNSLMMTE